MNEVRIEIDDASKTLRVGETLTTGSRYKIIVVGGAESVGNGSLLVFIDGCCAVHGEQVASSCALSAEGDDSTGILDLSTEALLLLAQRECGKMASLSLVLHSDTNAENVAFGRATVKLIPVGMSPSTGEANLFKGDKGDAGIGISSVTSKTNEDGSVRVWIRLTDNKETTFLLPKGDPGDPSKTTAVYCPETDLWHLIRLVKDKAGSLAVAIGSTGYKFDDLPDIDDPSKRAKQYADEAKTYSKDAEGYLNSSREVLGEAKDASLQAKEYMEGASKAGEEAGSRSGSAAAEEIVKKAKDEFGQIQSLSTEALGKADSLITEIQAEKSNIAASKEACESAAQSAKASSEEAGRLANEFRTDRFLTIDTDQSIDGLKKFEKAPEVRTSPDSDEFSEVATVKHVNEVVEKASSEISNILLVPSVMPTVSSEVPTKSTAVAGSMYYPIVAVIALAKAQSVAASGTATAQYSLDNSNWSEVDFNSDGFACVRLNVDRNQSVWIKSSLQGAIRYAVSAYWKANVPSKAANEE